MNEKDEDQEIKDFQKTFVALKTCAWIFSEWGLSDQDRSQLLSSTSDEERLIKASYIIGIYKNLHILFENSDQADNWIHRPNRYFEGRPALDVMLEGDLKRVRSYLDYMVSN